ncbi:uncharacterized protein SPAPADRAFT_58546 [Spathaspora passalidarum NRRL Y-27907]|uniref:Uncharacterized protein n=1 Tax=Spathaspora passalidarum (strain NRRL Y-27907 / 11-Y1) TaxID=619300 RepID=G3AGI1_SPAPN|nr:uncharacterized protein SPAPADRAFT_58546 [Spathaspora passalidarum NRRL Y-27907]EGW35320.1 hypothetical protein SPAPADRAFT_58546 [Spathaspora passalidarum NRRL Y-27907]
MDKDTECLQPLCKFPSADQSVSTPSASQGSFADPDKVSLVPVADLQPENNEPIDSELDQKLSSFQLFIIVLVSLSLFGLLHRKRIGEAAFTMLSYCFEKKYSSCTSDKILIKSVYSPELLDTCLEVCNMEDKSYCTIIIDESIDAFWHPCVIKCLDKGLNSM